MKRQFNLLVVSLALFSSNLKADAVLRNFPPSPGFSGCLKGDCFNGYGTYAYANGDKYVGDFKEGKPHGKGILYAANGGKYLGDWRFSFKEGQGRFTFAEGHEYTGAFQRDNFSGKGIMRFANGNVYDGNWSNNQPNGTGTFTFAGGDRYEGNFLNGKFDGQGSMFYKDGSKFVGLWQESRKHGKGVFYDAKGKTTPEEWKNGTAIRAAGGTHNEGSGVVVNPTEETGKTTSGDAAPESSIRIWAVVVGIASYAHMPSLRYPDDDAYQFYAFLKGPEGGALPDEQVEILVDEMATRDNILGTMRSVFAKADNNDVVMFYFSGHGIEGAFVPVDFDGYNYRLYHDDIREILESSKAKYKLVVGDACHAGTLLGDTNEKSNLLASREGVQTMLDKYYKAFEKSTGGTALLMSSKGQEVSLEDSGLRSGVFSHYLIRGIKGEADMDNNKIVTIEELSTYVKAKVSYYTAGAQTPVITGKFDRMMPVGVVRH